MAYALPQAWQSTLIETRFVAYEVDFNGNPSKIWLKLVKNQKNRV